MCKYFVCRYIEYLLGLAKEPIVLRHNVLPMSYMSVADENALFEKLTFSAEGLIPVIVQDAKSKDVLMFAFANREAVSLTLETGFAHYFSRSRAKLWKKGEEQPLEPNSAPGCDEPCFYFLSDRGLHSFHSSAPGCELSPFQGFEWAVSS